MRNILLIGMNFYDYEAAIIKKLEELDYNVFYFCDRNSYLNSHFHFLPRIITDKELIYYQKKALKDFSNIKFEYVLVLVGRYLKKFFLEEIRQKNPNSKFVLYLWDDTKRVENFNVVKSLYDRIYSFDPTDAMNYGFDFLPLFYRYRITDKVAIDDLSYDIYAAMYGHSDREQIAKKIAEREDLSCKIIILVNGKTFFKKRVFNILKSTKGNIDYRFRKNKISEKELISQMLKSKALLDIQFPSQKGLTMRTFDALSISRKIITTNNDVKYYDFYKEQNILVVDRKNVEISKEFLETPYLELEDSIINKYSLDNWLHVLLEGKKERYLVFENPYKL